MTEEHKHEKPKKKFSLNLKMSKWDKISIMILLVFVILVTLPTLVPKDGCEVARAGYKCASLEEVMVEHCEFWGEYDCVTEADVSLEQVEWYIGNLCNLQNQEHNTGLDCSNLKSACNQISGSIVCS
ncbi:MAG: hypothetical protein ABIE55_03445 [Candidatus Aenigmatarchaeota archaeon]